MMIREELLSIEEYCAEHKVSHKQHLIEPGIPCWSFYRAKRKYLIQNESSDAYVVTIGAFVKMS